MAQEKSTRIFISYRREDTGREADNIFLRLQKAFGDSAVFKDDGVINPGDKWEDKILTHLENAVVVLALIGNNFLCKKDGRLRLEEEGDWVRRELEYGLQSEGVTVISLLVGRDQLPPAGELVNVPVIQKLLLGRQAYGTIRAESMERDLYKLIHKDLPALGILPLQPVDASVQAVNRKLIKKTASLNFWQRLFFSFLSEPKKQRLAFEALRLFDNNEISHFCDTLSGYLTLHYKDNNARLLDFSKSFFSILNRKQGGNRFYLLLGETGSGKSTALAHLFTRFAAGKSNYKIVFAQFHKDLRPVYDLEDKENTILLLDGIDEAGEALRDPKGFFSEVENATKDFAKVVISCRTQFFVNQAAERKETDTQPRNPYNKAYLEFLSLDTVKARLSEIFPITRENEKYRLALSIVNRSGDHFTRPLLLPYISEMVEHSGRFLFFTGNSSGRDAAITSYEIYDVIIQNWIEREKSRIKKAEGEKKASGEDYGKALWEASLSIAQFLYEKESKEGTQYILFVDLKWLPQRLNLAIDDVHLRTDSLLHRNAAGYYRFAHRTFKEFFYAVLVYEGHISESEFPFEFYVDAARFYQEMCEVSYFREQPKERRRRHKPGRIGYTPHSSPLGATVFAFAYLEGISPDWDVFQIFRQFTSDAFKQGHFDAFVDCAEYLVKEEADGIPEEELVGICEAYGLETADLLQYFFFCYHQLDNSFRFLHRSFAEFLCLDEMIMEEEAAAETIARFPFEKLRFVSLFANEIKWLYLRQHGKDVLIQMDNHSASLEEWDRLRNQRKAGMTEYTYVDYLNEKSSVEYSTFLTRLWQTRTVKIRCQDAQLLSSLPYTGRIKHLDISHNGLSGPIDLKAFNQLELVVISGNPGLELKPSLPPSSLQHIIYVEPQGQARGLAEIKERFPDIAISPNGNAAFTLFGRPFQEPAMVEVDGGKFWRGSDENPDANDYPRHLVELPDYRIGKYPVTIREFACFVQETGYITTAEQEGWSMVATWQVNTLTYFLKVGANWMYDVYGKPLDDDMGNHPVVHISWYDAQAYCRWLSEKTGKRYRLLTEAEWEYAAIGGQKAVSRDENGNIQRQYAYAGSDNLNEVGWHFEKFEGRPNNGYSTQQVGLLKPNELGLFDLSGNVWEWCSDWYSADYYRQFEDKLAVNPQGTEDESTYRVLRGGSWLFIEDSSRVPVRSFNDPLSRDIIIGFRLAQDL